MGREDKCNHRKTGKSSDSSGPRPLVSNELRW